MAESLGPIRDAALRSRRTRAAVGRDRAPWRVSGDGARGDILLPRDRGDALRTRIAIGPVVDLPSLRAAGSAVDVRPSRRWPVAEIDRPPHARSRERWAVFGPFLESGVGLPALYERMAAAGLAVEEIGRG